MLTYQTGAILGTTQGLTLVSQTSVQELLYESDDWSGVCVSLSPSSLLMLSFFAKYHEAARE